VLFTGTFNPGATGHSHANAYWLGVAAELAYSDAAAFRAGVAAWGVTCRHVNVASTQAHVAAAKDFAIVAFRGTEPSPGDIATDARFKRVRWSGAGEIHDGFRGALDAAWPELLKAVVALAQPGQRLWFTGHSLGGALAVLAAARWAEEARTPAIGGVYTIGQPRVGDAAFSASYDRALGKVTFRYVHNRDPVPRVPMRVLGYKDVGAALHFDDKGRLESSAASWLRMLGVAFTDPDKIRGELKGAIGDHAARKYVECLRRAAGA
jgi:triacylglycerol lipase